MLFRLADKPSLQGTGAEHSTFNAQHSTLNIETRLKTDPLREAVEESSRGVECQRKPPVTE
jgi:hypothetical protein